jgi:phage/plasmid-like protein (TIGR03299 family)
MTTQEADRKVPWIAVDAWRNQGEQIQGSFTDSLAISDLAWEPRMDPVYQGILSPEGVTMQEMEKYRVVVRNDTQAPLGIVSPNYQPFTNREFASFMDGLVDHAGAQRAGLGSVKGGRQVYGVVKLDPSQYDLNDGGYGCYVFGVNGHGGASALHAGVTIIRYACTNGMIGVVPGSTHFVKVRHSGNIKWRVLAATAILRRSAEYVKAFGAEREHLIGIELSESIRDQLVEQLMPLPKQRQTERTMQAVRNQRQELSRFIHYSPNIEGIRATGWGFINGVAEYDQWGNHPRRTRTEMDRLIDGDQGKIVARARELVLN